MSDQTLKHIVEQMNRDYLREGGTMTRSFMEKNEAFERTMFARLNEAEADDVDEYDKIGMEAITKAVKEGEMEPYYEALEELAEKCRVKDRKISELFRTLREMKVLVGE